MPVVVPIVVLLAVHTELLWDLAALWVATATALAMTLAAVQIARERIP